jgi:hypothetical protein
MKPQFPPPSIAAAVLLTAFFFTSGCQPSDGGTSASSSRIWTLRHLRDEALAGRRLASWPATEWLTPRGQPLPLWSPPYHDTPLTQSEEQDGLNVLPAFSEGQPAALTVVEVWERVPEVWVQPWYVLVTAYDAANPAAKRLPDALALVDISEDSLFYSPFWEFIYVVVPEDTPPDRYRRASDLFAAKLPMHRGGGFLAPLTPPDVLTAVARGGSGPVRPLSGEPVGAARPGEAWLHGERVPYLNFGANTFTWSTAPERNGIIDEAALFIFARLDESGRPVSLGLPPVLGTGPRGAARPARVTAAGVPQFGTLTRPHFALLPPTAGPFIPSRLGLLKEQLRGQGVSVVDVHPAVEALPQAKDYVLRVALNPDCFKAAEGFPGTCRWLDSQAAVEANLTPAAVLPQDVLFTSPVLYFNGRKVGR